MTALLLIAACQSQAVDVVPPVPAVVAEPASPVAEPELPVAAPTPAPRGPRIGGTPILHQPVVVGGIATEVVVSGMATQTEAFNRCYHKVKAEDPSLAGRIALRFSIDKQGVVQRPSVLSTSLRHPEMESCLVGVLASTRFERLANGDSALVWSYPLAFGLD